MFNNLEVGVIIDYGEEANRITKFLRKVDVKWLESEASRLNKKGWNTHVVNVGLGDNVRYALYKIKDYK